MMRELAPFRARGDGAPQLRMQCSAAVPALLCLVHGAMELWVFAVVTTRAALVGGELLAEVRTSVPLRLLSTGLASPNSVPITCHVGPVVAWCSGDHAWVSSLLLTLCTGTGTVYVCPPSQQVSKCVYVYILIYIHGILVYK